MSYRITVLVENEALQGSGLEAEHGLSLFVETEGTAYLFDCGQTGMFRRNAERLGVDLSLAEAVILSHSHYDHAGGFPSLMECCRPKRIYTGPSFWQEKYSYDREGDMYFYKGCGLSQDDLKAWGVEERTCGSILELRGDVRIFTGFPQKYPFEQIPEKFCRGEEKEKDPFEDEICLLLPEEDGLALVAGRSHRGILNMTAAVRASTGLPVRRIVGGIHLTGADRKRVDRTLAELERLGVRHLNLCHCSGVSLPGKLAAGSVLFRE